MAAFTLSPMASCSSRRKAGTFTLDCRIRVAVHPGMPPVLHIDPLNRSGNTPHTEKLKADAKAFVGLAVTGRYRTNREIAAALGIAEYRATRVRQYATRNGLITDQALKGLMNGSRAA